MTKQYLFQENRFVFFLLCHSLEIYKGLKNPMILSSIKKKLQSGRNRKSEQTSEQIESVMKSLSGKNGPRADSFTGEFYQIFKEKHQSFSNSSQKFQRGGTLPNSFYEARVTLLLKPEKTLQGNYRPISQMNIDEQKQISQ